MAGLTTCLLQQNLNHFLSIGLGLGTRRRMPARNDDMSAGTWGRLWDSCLIAFLIAASLAAILRIGLLPRDLSVGVAVIYAPGTSAEETLVRAVSAGGRFVRFGGFDFIAIVMPETPDYLEQVLAGSALLAVDPRVLAACLPASFRQ
jgi:hypothetical protein